MVYFFKHPLIDKILVINNIMSSSKVKIGIPLSNLDFSVICNKKWLLDFLSLREGHWFQ